MVAQVLSHPLQGHNHARTTRWVAAARGIALTAAQGFVLAALLLAAMPAAAVAATPASLMLWGTGVLSALERRACTRDPGLAAVAAAARDARRAWGAAAVPLVRCWLSLVGFALHAALSAFVRVARPRVAFVIYAATPEIMSKFCCVGTAELLTMVGVTEGMCVVCADRWDGGDEKNTRARFSISLSNPLQKTTRRRNPDTPDIILMGVIFMGVDGLGVYGTCLPCLSQLTAGHLAALPASVRTAFPCARAVALAGRLPGLLSQHSVAIDPPLVDGLSGTVFAMESAVRALAAQAAGGGGGGSGGLTVAVVGGGGYLGTRLVAALTAAVERPAEESGDPQEAAGGGAGGGRHGGGQCTTTPLTPFARVIALDSRYAGPDGTSGRTGYAIVPVALGSGPPGRAATTAAVVRTADQTVVAGADVILVITATGDDAAGCAAHAVPGQAWGDDTHPEMSAALVAGLRVRGAAVHKTMATRACWPTVLVPPLPGWPAVGTPGCLLQALVTARMGIDWSDVRVEDSGGGGGPARPGYPAFCVAADAAGFRALLAPHRRSKIDCGVPVGVGRGDGGDLSAKAHLAPMGAARLGDGELAAEV